jgi:hypothetical protein
VQGQSPFSTFTSPPFFCSLKSLNRCCPAEMTADSCYHFFKPHFLYYSTVTPPPKDTHWSHELWSSSCAPSTWSPTAIAILPLESPNHRGDNLKSKQTSGSFLYPLVYKLDKGGGTEREWRGFDSLDFFAAPFFVQWTSNRGWLKCEISQLVSQLSVEF